MNGGEAPRVVARICKTPGCVNRIPYDPERRHQHRYCDACRSRYGSNVQRSKQKSAAKKRRKTGGETDGQ